VPELIHACFPGIFRESRVGRVWKCRHAVAEAANTFGEASGKKRQQFPHEVAKARTPRFTSVHALTGVSAEHQGRRWSNAPRATIAMACSRACPAPPSLPRTGPHS